MKRMQKAELFPEDLAERIAEIIGPQSACQAALDTLRARRAAGEDVVLFRAGDMILVGPRTPPTS